MNIKKNTIEEAEKIYKERCEGIAEIARLNKKAKDYKKKTRKNELLLNIKWSDTFDIDALNNLKTPLGDEFKQSLINDFTIINLNLEKVLTDCCDDVNKVFPKSKLWFKRTDANIARLIETIENETELIPPVLELTDDSLSIVDGNHRIALCQYLDLETIPFLIKTSQLHYVDKYK